MHRKESNRRVWNQNLPILRLTWRCVGYYSAKLSKWTNFQKFENYSNQLRTWSVLKSIHKKSTEKFEAKKSLKIKRFVKSYIRLNELWILVMYSYIKSLETQIIWVEIYLIIKILSLPFNKIFSEVQWNGTISLNNSLKKNIVLFLIFE